MKRKHTLNKGGAVGAMPPTLYVSKPGGGGGGLGGVAYQDRARPPPRGRSTRWVGGEGGGGAGSNITRSWQPATWGPVTQGPGGSGPPSGTHQQRAAGTSAGSWGGGGGPCWGCWGV